MKKFRVTKCIKTDGKGVEKFAIFSDGSRKKQIYVDDNGYEYFNIDNWINSDPKLDIYNCTHRQRLSFFDKPKDMLLSVYKGFGDVIISNKSYGDGKSVRYYLDREYGEQLRQKTLDEWKNVEFGYAVRDLSGSIIKADNTIYYKSPILYFQTIEQAERYIENLKNSAKNIIDFYVRNNVLDTNKNSVFYDLAFSCLDEENGKLIQIKDPKDVMYKIIQCVIKE